MCPTKAKRVPALSYDLDLLRKTRPKKAVNAYITIRCYTENIIRISAVMLVSEAKQACLSLVSNSLTRESNAI